MGNFLSPYSRQKVQHNLHTRSWGKRNYPIFFKPSDMRNLGVALKSLMQQASPFMQTMSFLVKSFFYGIMLLK